MSVDPARHESERRKSLESYEAKSPVLRVSDVERERAVAQLRQHMADGRLDVDEFRERIDEAYAARTTADLQHVLRELPHVQVREPDTPALRAERSQIQRKKRREFQQGLVSYVLVNTFLVGIWLVTSIGAGELLYFWPAFPMLGWGLGVAFHAWAVYGRLDDD
jgi:hypothetical protein